MQQASNPRPFWVAPIGHKRAPSGAGFSRHWARPKGRYARTFLRSAPDHNSCGARPDLATSPGFAHSSCAPDYNLQRAYPAAFCPCQIYLRGPESSSQLPRAQQPKVLIVQHGFTNKIKSFPEIGSTALLGFFRKCHVDLSKITGDFCIVALTQRFNLRPKQGRGARRRLDRPRYLQQA